MRNFVRVPEMAAWLEEVETNSKNSAHKVGYGRTFAGKKQTSFLQVRHQKQFRLNFPQGLDCRIALCYFACFLIPHARCYHLT